MGERCDQKCIQIDLDTRCNVHVRWNRNQFYSSERDARPNHFVCTSGRNATQASYATLAQAYIVNRPLLASHLVEWFETTRKLRQNLNMPHTVVSAWHGDGNLIFIQQYLF